MTKKFLFLNFVFLLIFFLFFINNVAAAHFIVGEVLQSNDGISPNGQTIFIFNPVNGLDDNLTDIVGQSGNSGVNGYYLLDCELLDTPCEIDDVITIQISNLADSIVTAMINVTVSGFGFDIADTLRINSVPVITSIFVDDDFSDPSGEIDLIVADTKKISCQAVVYDADGDSDINSSFAFFYQSSIPVNSSDDNNNHYSNSSCFIDSSFGNSNESLINCSFAVFYFAESSSWNCSLFVNDSFSIQRSGINTTFINPLLAIGSDSEINYGLAGPSTVSSEVAFNITNFGNVRINISLEGYAQQRGDNLSMNCSDDFNISVYYQKFNLSASNPGFLSFSEFEVRYSNLSSSEIIHPFNLLNRQNDSFQDAVNTTYWRIYAPSGAPNSNCSGNVIFGARLGS